MSVVELEETTGTVANERGTVINTKGMVGLDTVGDGRIDAIGMDTTGDGKIDTIEALHSVGMDTTGDGIIDKPLPQDDPKQRQPNINRAKDRLEWEPKVALREGLTKTISYFDDLLAKTA